jgi:hypothetical protein
VRLSRAKGWKLPPNTVKVDRATKYGNPFRLDVRTRFEAVSAFQQWMTIDTCTAGMADRRNALRTALPELRGKNLACWCPLDQPCHADVLLDLANGPAAHSNTQLNSPAVPGTED